MRSKAILTGAFLLLLILAGCGLTLGPTQAPAATQPGGAMPPTATPAQPTATPVPPTAAAASPSPRPIPAVTETPRPTGAPMAPAPTKSCGSGPPPASLSQFPAPAQTVTDGGVEYVLVGRTLTVDFQLVDSEGTAEAYLHRVQAESCTVDLQLEYDWVYTAHYARRCPQGLADFPEPESGPWGLVVSGRAFWKNGYLVELSGTETSNAAEENGTCQGVSWRYIVYFAGTPAPFPAEASTLLLLGSGVTTLAGWAALQIRGRKRRSRRAGAHQPHQEGEE